MRIVCAGAGFTSIAVAPYLKKHLPQAHITVISKEKYHTLYAHTPELISSKIRLEHHTVNLEKHFTTKGVEFIKGVITHINRDTKTVSVGSSTVAYDYLLLDIGSQADTSSVPGAQAAIKVSGALSMLELRQHVITQLIKARNTNNPSNKTFVVVGAGVSGIEVASEVAALTQQACENHFLFPEEIATILVEHGAPSEYPWDKKTAERIEGILEDRSVEYYADALRAYNSEGAFLTDRIIETETLVWSAQKRGNKLIEQMGLALNEHKAAWVNEYLQTSDPFIFAVGDAAAFKNVKHPVPRTAFMAFDEQRAVADNIIAAVNGKELKKYTPPPSVPIVITTGNNEALLLVGKATWHGRFPYLIKNWFRKKYARSINT